MIEQLLEFLKEWRTAKEIEDYFGINARTMRMHKVYFNDEYDPIHRPKYILSGNRGYRVTTNTSDIRRNNKEVNLTQAITMLKQYWKIEKNFKDIDNFKLDLWSELEEGSKPYHEWKVSFIKKWVDIEERAFDEDTCDRSR